MATDPDANATWERSGASQDDTEPSGPPPAWTAELPARYRFQRPLGKGGMGEVVLVYDEELQREVAMKLLLGDNEHQRHRFMRESHVQALLQHPNVVPLFDRGELSDGRPWYTMQVIRGQPLRGLIDEWWEDRDGARETWSLHRFVGVLAVVARAVAYAHTQGVVHRDLKPDNLMVGAFGEVQILDWGIARIGEQEPGHAGPAVSGPALTSAGWRVGTAGYMAPEQAMGQTQRHGPHSDVYAIGVILWELLAGRPPPLYGPLPDDELTGPSALQELVKLLLRRKPEERLLSRQVPEALERWLDGSRRKQEALDAFHQAVQAEQAPQQLRVQAHALREQAEVLQDALPAFASEEDKQPMWALEAQAEALETDAALLEVEVLQGVRAALNLFPELSEAHAFLADHYHRELREAEAHRDAAGRTRALAMLKSHDRGRYTAWLRGKGMVSLQTDPPGAHITVYRYVEEGRRLREVEVDRLSAPLDKHVLDAGSYLLLIEAEGCEPVRYPVAVDSLEHWDAVPSGETEPRPVWLPPLGTLRPGECFVPAGWCVLGGDPVAQDGLVRTRVWLEDFALSRSPVTFGQYLEFINALWATGDDQRVWELIPGNPLTASGERELVFVPGEHGFEMVQGHVRGWTVDHPVVLVDQDAAAAFVAWTGAQLPLETQWEKAARGVDGRRFPWGDRFDPTFANVQLTRQRAEAVSVAACLADESPYGVTGLAGNVRDWCGSAYRQQDGADPRSNWRVIRGGSFADNRAAPCAAASRFASPADARFAVVSLRPARVLRCRDDSPSSG